MTKPLTHLDEAGRAKMVDVSHKPSSARVAVAEGVVRMRPETLQHALAGDAKKGDVRALAEIAGIMAAKQTASLIPLCHPLPLSSIEVTVTPDSDLPGFAVRTCARATGPTGAEMEALTAASVACLTIYDMLKALDRDMTIERVRVLEKSGGASGAYRRDEGAC